MDSKLIGRNILVMVEQNEQLTISTFIAFIRQEFGYTITYHNAWLAKQLALEKDSNYSYTGQVEPIPNKVIFHRFFWSFKAYIDVFACCKPIVQIDGTWLYGRYKGTLLIAVAQDGANNIFPLAFAIVEGETVDG
ncbi:uncharacterized protein LOC114383855 [Glycine soja]|uniref:uncharacterized protein n=1 Tax=Glycine max TaxID=3847 RepID=UPI0003DE8FB9|nr:uncharacterized protein LOC102667067 [Glycine max]XP_028199381.1 uncharacterized protein LOC114383855 [Glycine soja]|eukprot:XP_006596699.1 uncharacterized protein LOC102667067 [Glycine max]